MEGETGQALDGGDGWGLEGELHEYVAPTPVAGGYAELSSWFLHWILSYFACLDGETHIHDVTKYMVRKSILYYITFMLRWGYLATNIAFRIHAIINLLCD